MDIYLQWLIALSVVLVIFCVGVLLLADRIRALENDMATIKNLTVYKAHQREQVIKYYELKLEELKEVDKEVVK